MDNKELIVKFANEAGITQGKSKELIKILFDVITEELAIGGSVKINKFGVFETRIRDARQGFNPKTREVLEIPEKKYPAFKPTKNLKDLVAEK